MDEEVVSQSIDSFWGCELSGTKKCYEYDESEDSQDGVETLFEFRQACLGAKAKNGERNVVQLTTESIEGESVTHTILSMRMGVNEQVPMFLTVKPPVKLELVQGSGPVHIVGSQIVTLEDTSDEDDDESEESPVKPEAKRKAAKRPADSPVQKAPKLAKLVEEEAEEGSEEEPDEEEEEMEFTLPSKTGRELSSKLRKPEEFVEANSDDDEDDEDFDEDDEDDDIMDGNDFLEESDEDDDSEEEEEEEVKPRKKSDKKVVLKTDMVTKVTKGVAKRGLKGDLEREIFPEKTKSILKTPPVGSKGGKGSKVEGSGKKGAQGPLSIEEIKAKLIQSPNLPKKLEKFNNYIASSFKITDNITKKKLWEYVQSNRK